MGVHNMRHTSGSSYIPIQPDTTQLLENVVYLWFIHDSDHH